jgi:hypothetical protein
MQIMDHNIAFKHKMQFFAGKWLNIKNYRRLLLTLAPASCAQIPSRRRRLRETFGKIFTEMSAACQGDQIGRNFAHWVIVYKRQCFENYIFSLQYCGSFSMVKVML